MSTAQNSASLDDDARGDATITFARTPKGDVRDERSANTKRSATKRNRVAGVRYRISLFQWLLQFADLAALIFAGYCGYFIRFGALDSSSSSAQVFVYLSSLGTYSALYLAGSYRRNALSSLSTQLHATFVGGIGALLMILICGYFSGVLHEYSRIWVLSGLFVAIALLLLNRVLIDSFVRRAIRAMRLMETVVIVGANEHAEKVILTISNSPACGINILGVFDDRVNRPIPATVAPHVLGATDELLLFVRRNQVDRVVVALPWLKSDRIDELLKKLRSVPVRIDLVPNDVIWQFPTANMERLAGVPILTVANRRVDEQIGVLKRIEDLIVSSCLLILTSPLLLAIAIAVKIDSPGPALYRQKRHGFNNEIFDVYKFRSMKQEDRPLAQATRNDPRITRVGKFLRRSSLDELPQLWNVLIGNMSIVGPRPHAVQHNVEYASIISEYFARHNVKPGITGWAQVNGLRGETDTPDKMRRRVDADLHYIENWSLLLDFKVILMTAITVWFQDTAY
jgi:Undecaprenyl-phosphate glucose phosphotransferase